MIKDYFPNLGLFFEDIKRDKDYKIKEIRNIPTQFVYKETIATDLYYIFEELKEGEKEIQLIGFMVDFDLAKKLVKELNIQSKSNRFDFDKVKLMDEDKIESILSGNKKES